MVNILARMSACGIMVLLISCCGDRGSAVQSQPSKGEVPVNSKRKAQEDVVHLIMPGEADNSIGIGFIEHAAVYYLHREDPHFSEWFAAIQESKKTGAHILFNYVDEGQRLTFVELVK